MAEAAASELAIELLQEAVQRYEEDRKRGRLNLMLANAIGETAVLLHVDSIAGKMAQVLQDAPDEQFFKRTLSNFPLPERAPPALRRLPTREEAAQQLPRWSVEDTRRLAEGYGRSEHHLRLCTEEKWEEARNVCADDPVKQLEVAVTQAAIGDLDEAIRRMKDLMIEEWRRRHSQIVCAIELARHGRLEECVQFVNSVRADHQASDIHQWNLVQLAMGIAGYQPWGGYPFSDY